jgi:hypothetical protein
VAVEVGAYGAVGDGSVAQLVALDDAVAADGGGVAGALVAVALAAALEVGAAGAAVGLADVDMDGGHGRDLAAVDDGEEELVVAVCAEDVFEAEALELELAALGVVGDGPDGGGELAALDEVGDADEGDRLADDGREGGDDLEVGRVVEGADGFAGVAGIVGAAVAVEGAVADRVVLAEEGVEEGAVAARRGGRRSSSRPCSRRCRSRCR